MVAPHGAPDTAPSAHDTYISVRAVQPENALVVMDVTAAGSAIDVRAVHPANAILPIVFTPGILTFAKLLQNLKQLPGTDVNAGKFADTSDAQP